MNFLSMIIVCIALLAQLCLFAYIICAQFVEQDSSQDIANAPLLSSNIAV